MSKSLWPASPDRFTRPMEENLDAPIVIVGAGISGLTAACELARKGLAPVLVDAGRPGAGETHKTTAHLASVIDDRFVNIARWHGDQGAKLAYQSHAAAIDWIEKTVGELGIECEFSRLNGYLFAAREEDKDFLLEELEAGREAGHTEAQWLAGTPLQGLEQYPCIVFPNQARFNPGLYFNGLLEEVCRLGVRIYRDARILSWEDKGRVLLKTDKGLEISCDKVIFACNDPFVRFRYYTLHAPYRTYAVALRVPDDVETDGLYWDVEDPYHYIRFASDPGGNGRVAIVGGEDHKTGQKEHAETSWARLAEWSRMHLPFVGESVAQWSGQVLETVDGLAFIGKDPGGRGKIFLVSGDSGMGLTHGTLGGILLGSLVTGENHPWQELYDPGRFRWKAFPEYVQENANVARQYTHVLLPAPDKKRELSEGHGVVVQEGLKKVACVGQDGSRRELTAICTHLGGLVRWNEAEGTWDCECHGSRFTASGEVLNGPAVTPLKVRDPKERRGKVQV